MTVGSHVALAFLSRTIWAAVLLAGLSGCTLYHGPNAYMPSRNGIDSGETITVKGNENIYTVAREHNVSMRELIVLNDLKPPFEIRPGQSLTLPGTGSSFAGDMKPPSPAPLGAVEKSSLAPIEPAAVTSEPLALPPTAPPPSSNPAPSQATPLGLLPVQPPPQQQSALPKAAVTASEPVKALNQPSPQQKQVATTMLGMAGASPPTPPNTAATPIDMKWPVQGPILSSFGAKGTGLSNDGVNIGAPKGAPVVAAAPGTVVYAGNEMKGFGNLVLIRHQNDWVTAYAHLDRVLVKKDSIVAQGDMIATVGKTGNVASPQLHFEIRQGGKAVDPATVIKSNT